MLLTDFEKRIYNEHLIASRTAQNKPFKVRKDFTKLKDETYIILKKLSAFFNANENVGIKDFFTAPYSYYNEGEYFDLDFFLSQKAIKCYTLFKKSQELHDPNDEKVINICKECIIFIYNYCNDNNITLDEYKTQINGSTPIVLQHLRDHKINFYTLHGLDCEKALRQVEPDLLEFFISDFNNILQQTRLNFSKTTRLKQVIRESLLIVDKKLLKNKTNRIQ